MSTHEKWHRIATLEAENRRLRDAGETLGRQYVEAKRERDEARQQLAGSQAREAALELRVEELRKALDAQACRCNSRVLEVCPRCGGELEAVAYPSGSMLNPEQFDAIRAGDWFCAGCPGSESNTGYKYWWNKDLQSTVEKCARCQALSTPASDPSELLQVMRQMREALGSFVSADDRHFRAEQHCEVGSPGTKLDYLKRGAWADARVAIEAADRLLGGGK